MSVTITSRKTVKLVWLPPGKTMDVGPLTVLCSGLLKALCGWGVTRTLKAMKLKGSSQWARKVPRLPQPKYLDGDVPTGSFSDSWGWFASVKSMFEDWQTELDLWTLCGPEEKKLYVGSKLAYLLGKASKPNTVTRRLFSSLKRLTLFEHASQPEHDWSPTQAFSSSKLRELLVRAEDRANCNPFTERPWASGELSNNVFAPRWQPASFTLETGAMLSYDLGRPSGLGKSTCTDDRRLGGG